MRFRRSLIAIAFAATVALPAISAVAQEAIPGDSVESLLAYARERHPELRAMRYEADAAAQRVDPAGALPDPMFRMELQNVTNYGNDGSFSLSPANVGSTKYTIAQSIPFWGKRDLRQGVAQADALQADRRVNATWAELAAKIKIAYAQYQLAARSEELAREVLTLMGSLESLAQVRYASGLVPQQDAIRAQVEQTGMRTDLVMLDSERRQWQVKLNSLLTRPANAPLADPRRTRALPPPARLDPAALSDRLVANNPQLAVEDARIQSAERGRDLTYRNRYPDFSVGVSPIQMGSRINEWELMLEVNIPLQQGSRRAQESEAESMLSAARSRKEAALLQARAELGEHVAALDAARRIEELLTTQLLPQAGLTLQSAMAAYENGRVDFATLLEAQRQIRKAKQDREKANAEAQMRLAEIERLLGEDFVKTGTAALAAATMLALGVAGGYWWAQRTPAVVSNAPPTPAAAITPGATPGDAAKPARKLRFYRNPMGLPDTSPTPKKDPMGMDYIPVYEGEDDAADDGKTVKISVDRVQKLGVRTEPAALRVLERNVRALGRVEIDERRVVAVAPKFEGWVEKLLVNATGQPVAKGQPLFEVYSPELVSAQREYAIAVKGVEALKDAGGDAQAGMSRLAESSLARLRNWDIPDEQVKALVGSGEIRRTLTFRSPAGGIVLEKKALQGMRFMPGEALFQIADLSALWVIADVFEQDLGQVRVGSTAKLRFNAYPGKTFDGRITYIYPTLKPETRTVPIRIELANPGQQLKPAMFAEVELPVGARAKVVTVPTSAVIDSGTRRIVFIQRAEGRYEPREVKLGARSDTHVEILDGVTEGEPVVTAANFLIDAESNLKAAIGGFGSATTTGASEAAKVGHKGHGTVVAIDAKGGTLSIKHDPVPSLKWPAMTMEFVPANPSLLQGLSPGSTLDFEFVERKPGEWVITSIAPPGAVAAPAKANPHAAH